MSSHYILDDEHNPVAAGLLEWAEYFENPHNRRVREDFVGSTRISTIFLGLNHQWLPNKPPLIFETMVFGGQIDCQQTRYSTWNEAVAGHQAIVALARALKL